jgi:hypothetical protein
MMTVLASWAGLVVEERDVFRSPERDVLVLAEFLGAHLDWLAEHFAAADLAAEIETLVRAAEDTISPDPGVRVELGRCDEAGCGAVVSATLRGRGGIAPQVIRCDGGHVWPPKRWLILKSKFEQASL